jgi:hypothetical protein
MMHPRCATVQSDADLARIIGSRIATFGHPTITPRWAHRSVER